MFLLWLIACGPIPEGAEPVDADTTEQGAHVTVICDAEEPTVEFTPEDAGGCDGLHPVVIRLFEPAEDPGFGAPATYSFAFGDGRGSGQSCPAFTDSCIEAVAGSVRLDTWELGERAIGYYSLALEDGDTLEGDFEATFCEPIGCD